MFNFRWILGLTNLTDQWTHMSKYKFMPLRFRTYVNTWDNSVFDISACTKEISNSVLDGYEAVLPIQSEIPFVESPFTGTISSWVDGTNLPATLYQTAGYEVHLESR